MTKKISHYSIFFDWLFDGNMKSPIPTHSDFDLFKYNSPINETFLLKMFINNGSLNYLLNDYNNIGIRYIDREELFIFIKSCVIGFKIKRNTIHYSQYRNREKIFSKLTEKFPLYKHYEISLLIDKIENIEPDKKQKIYSSLGIEDKKKIVKKKSTSESKITKISMEEFISNNFELYPVD